MEEQMAPSTLSGVPTREVMGDVKRIRDPSSPTKFRARRHGEKRTNADRAEDEKRRRAALLKLSEGAGKPQDRDALAREKDGQRFFSGGLGDGVDGAVARGEGGADLNL